MSNQINPDVLKGKALKVYENALQAADANGNKVVDAEEVSIFNEYIENSAALTKREKKIILGEKEVKEPSEAKQARQAKRADKKEDKVNEKTFNNTLQTFTNKGYTRNEIIAALNDELIQGNPSNKEKYGELIKMVEDKVNGLAWVNKDNTMSMAQVDALFESFVAEAKTSTEKNVLRQVAQMIKNEKLAAAKKEISELYEAKVIASVENGVERTDKDIMDEILRELKASKKYIDDGSENEYVDAYKLFNNGEIAKQSRLLLANVITGKTTPDEVEGNKIYKEAKKWLKENGYWDVNVKQAARKQKFGKTYSDIEGLERNVALNTIKTREELEKALGNDAAGKIEALTRAKVTLLDEYGNTIKDDNGKDVYYNLITKREDGSYDLSILSRYIRQQVGSDNTYNKHKHNVNSEHGYLERGINGAITGDAYDLTDKEIKKLVTLCGFDKDGNYSLKAATIGALCGLSDGLTAGLATLSNDPQSFLILPPEMPDIEITNNININQILQEAGLDITVELTGSVKTIIKNIFADVEPFLLVAPKLIVDNAVKSAVLGAALGLLAGLDVEEIPAIPLKVEQRTLGEYYEALMADTKTKKYAPMLIALATAKFVDPETQKFDNDGFEKYLHRLFAGNDILNKKEVLALQKEYYDGFTHRLAAEKTVTTTSTTESQDEDPEKDVALVEKKPTVIENRYEEDTYISHKVKAGESWATIVEAYYPGLVEKYDGRMYDVWKNGKRIKKGAIGALKDALGAADPEVLKQLRNGGDIPRLLHLPLEIDGVKIKADAKVETTTIKNGGKTTLKEAGQKTRKPVVTYIPGADIYIAYDEATPAQKYTGASEEEAINNLKDATKKDYEEIKRTNY